MLELFNSFDVEKFNTESGKTFNNAIFANGIFQMRKSPMGTFIVPVEETDFTKFGLTKKCETSFIPDYTDIPKIPCGVLEQVIYLYREIYKTIASEVYCAIVWDRIKKDFFIHVPTQEVSAATISYTNTPEIYSNPDLVVVMDIHSHNVMNAFFSATDLADEMATRFFGVIGKINDTKPSMVVRAATNGIDVPLQIADIFDFSVRGIHPDSNYTVPLADYAKVTEFVPLPVKGKYTNMYSGYYDDDYYDYGTKTNYKKAVTTTTAPAKTGVESTNPYVRIYNQINMIRYGKTFNQETVLNFMETAVECAARYLEDFDVKETDIHHIAEQVELLTAFRFNSAIDAIHGDHDVADTTEVEFTSKSLGSENDNPSIYS